MVPKCRCSNPGVSGEFGGVKTPPPLLFNLSTALIIECCDALTVTVRSVFKRLYALTEIPFHFFH